eukprot:scaffold13641_cov42-Cyclotella_meneghiniana.AAC.7
MSDSSPLERGLKALTEKDSGLDSGLFIPKKLEVVKYGSLSLNAYPEVDHNSPAAERVFALMINKQAAEAQYCDPASVIDFYASRVGLESHAHVAVAQWTSRLKEKWADPANLTILSYHSASGNAIADAIDPATGVLCEITDGAAGTRRPAGVRLALVRCTISYDDLYYANDPTTLNVEYFIPLPVGTITFNHALGVATNRVTCTIDGDPFALTKEQFKTQVLDPVGVLGLVKLKAADVGGSESIFRKLGEQLAPTFSSTPHSTVEKITMSFGEGGNKVDLTVLEYHRALMRGSQTFLEDPLWPFILATHFANNLTPAIKAKFQNKTKHHLTFTDLSHDAQLQAIDTYLGIAIEMEKELRTTDTSTFLSAAEETLRKYAKDDAGNKHKYDEISKAVREILCWGCMGKHCWRDPHSKEIICPNKDKPGVAERAKMMHKQYLDNLKERRNGWIAKKKVKFSDLPANQKEKAHAMILKEASTIVSANAINPNSEPSGVSYPTYSYSATNGNVPPLPVQIDNRLPHITITLGKVDLSIKKCPQGHTCELTIVAKFIVRYCTVTGQPVTMTIALGRDIGVNTILGRPFIKSLQCVYDDYNAIVEARLLDASPFNVLFMVPQRYTTNKNNCKDGCSHNSDIVAALRQASNSKVLNGNVATKTQADTVSDHATPTASLAGSDDSIEFTPERGFGRGSVLWGKARPITPCAPVKRARFEKDAVPQSALRDDDYASDDDSPTAPIRVERRRKGRPQPNAYLDSRGVPDWQEEWEWLQEADYGKVLLKRKRKHDMRSSIDSTFNVPYDETKDDEYLRENLKISHLSPEKQADIEKLVKEYWPVFRPEGMSIPVLDYQCHIDTGSARPVRTKRTNFGPRESKIMQPMIDKLEEIDQIYQTFDGEWLSPCLLAPKPHQENCYNIEDYVWRLCVNYIGLNKVTKVVAYPIPRCDFAVMISMGNGEWRWLLDAPQGFHQIAIHILSQEKLAFAGPYTRKYTWKVMPFGPVNGPVIFVIFIHDCKADWDDLAIQRGLSLGDGTNSTIIIDDIHGMGKDWEETLGYLRCQLDVCLRRRLSINLKKCNLFTP